MYSTDELRSPLDLSRAELASAIASLEEAVRTLSAKLEKRLASENLRSVSAGQDSPALAPLEVRSAILPPAPEGAAEPASFAEHLIKARHGGRAPASCPTAGVDE